MLKSQVKTQQNFIYFSCGIVQLNIERFISSRLIAGKSHLRGYARPVILVSIISTALGVAVMLMSGFIARGFQNQIRTKVIGFGSHIQILPFMEEAETGSGAMPIDQDFYRDHSQFKEIKSMQPVGYKPGILQRVTKNEKGNREIQGVLFKGVNKDYDWDFIRRNMVKGQPLSFGTQASKDILVSQKIADNLMVNVGDTLAAVLISKTADKGVSPVFRKFRICGIYNTGLEEFDKEYVFIDLAHIQEANGWGIHIILNVNDTLKDGEVEIGLHAASIAAKLNWTINGRPYHYGTVRLPVTQEPKTYTIIASDADKDLVSDTAVISIKRGSDVMYSIVSNDDVYLKRIQDPGSRGVVSPEVLQNSILVWVSKLGGSQNLYAAAFEVNLHNWRDLRRTDNWLYKLTGPGYTNRTIVEQQEHIFNWLDLVDLNVTVIIGLMLLVALINLISAILVLILERGKMIGVLKSFGATNKMVGRIFFYFTASILFRGLIIGNLLALVLFFIQHYTGLIELNPETYFVRTVPLKFDWIEFLFINALTLVAGFLAFFLPVMLVSRIDPVKAIKIE